MNTLDVLHWMAITNKQPEIDRIAVALNKLLYYNLGKRGHTATIQEEIGSLKEYLTLFKIRYDFDYELIIQADDKDMSRTIPRFILQPLVENAILHGVHDNGKVQIIVSINELIEFRVQDNGMGMSADIIQRLLSNEQVENEKIGLGIGLNYVKRTLESYFDNEAKMEIESTIGMGTCINIKIPIREEI